PQAKTARVQHEYVAATLARYNPEIVAAAKEAALAALMKREVKDNAIAAEKGLKPYTLLNVEINDGADDRSSGYMGWYYVTLAVDGKIHTHLETGLAHDIANGKVSETPSKKDYYTAGALKEADVDYVFNNVGFSSTSTLYSLPVRDDVLERAEKTLAEREEAQAAAPAPEQTAEKPEASVTYYPINEDAARRAKEAMSFSDYRPGSATAEYRHYVDKAAEVAARQKKRVDPSFHAKIDGLLDTYARKLAANMNKGYEIAARVPSIMIAGPANFPVRQKQKQNAADEKNMQEFSEIQGLLEKIRSTGMGGISADDPNAISKLESKLAKLEALQETMKAVNAYYRKHKTVDGCPHLTAEQIEKMKASLSSDWRANPKPFESYQLSNNNAEIHRLKERIATLTRQKEVGYVGWEFDGGKVEANAGDNRLQIFFDGKPDSDTRDKLKEYGFKWSPSAGAWQRQLTDNAIRAADALPFIAPLTGERPTEVQKRARQEAAAQDAPREKAAAPEYIYKMEANPHSESSNDRFFLQAYLPQEDGKAQIGDVLYIGTAEKCREIMVQLAAGELTQGEVKELYAKAQEAEPDRDTFSIYQLKRGDDTRDYRFEPYDRLQAAGLAVDPANYDLIYTAPLAPGMSLDDIYTRFNIDHPADFKGHSLSVSDVIVLHQAGQDAAHYVDSFGYQEVPEFLQTQQELTPEACMTGEQIRTPRGSFHVTDMTCEQMEAAGYGFHHQSEDGKYFIMGNGTQAFAVAAEPQQSHLKHIEDTVEQNDNSFDGIINNTPPTPTVDELEAKVQAGEQISLLDLADAIKAEKERGGGDKPEKKPSIRAQLKADKERAAQRKTAAKAKSQDLERS
ncbi:MAG: YodL domain-containing protein, partial [Lachnospiraceae bacterium]|nr:YodL domain-containing protein [Lachnospiraceae bacterium]